MNVANLGDALDELENSPEYMLRLSIESAIETASCSVYDSTAWWDDYLRHPDGKRIVDVLIDSIAGAAKEYAETSKPRFQTHRPK